MPFSSKVQYHRAAKDEEEELDEHVDHELETESMARRCDRSSHRNIIWKAVSQILAIANIFLFFILLGAWINFSSIAGRYCLEGPKPPYSKVREDGAVKFINKRFKPQQIFQSEPTDEVDAAWNRTMQFDNSIGFTREFAAEHGLPRSIPSAHDPNVQLYGVSVFHQLHCLDMVRRALHPERFYPDTPRDEMVFHYNHCLDFLRQAIMCKADVSIIYWWNSNFTTVAEDGTKRDSDYYLSLSGEEREKQSFVKWDVEHQCHDFNLITDWLYKNRVDRNW